MAKELKPINSADKEEVLRSLYAYKMQNPAKYELKKAGFMSKYNLTLADLGEKEEVKENKAKETKETKESEKKAE